MNVFTGFGSWINQNMQQPLKAEAKRSSENGKERDIDEKKREGQLWRDAEKIHPWYDAPPKVKVKTEKGVCIMNIEMTLGLPPSATYEIFTNPNNLPLFSDKSWREILKNKSRKVIKEDGPRKISKLEKSLAWKFLWWSGSLPITLTVDENRQDFTAKYKKEKFMFMKVFQGSYKVEPLYIDSKRLCKNNVEPIKSKEEYKKCSNGQGKIASKVTMEQNFQPCPLLNLLPPVSWYIQGVTIDTTKTLLKMLQEMGAKMRETPPTQ
ncbi:unnamed protein product [Cochlearia groenlandica]